MRRGIACIVMAVACAVGVGACSGGGGHSNATATTQKTPATWDPTASATVANVVKEIQTAFPRQCVDNSVLSRAQYIVASNRIHTPMASAVQECDALTESLEISGFATPAARDRFIQSRTAVLCRTAAKSHAELPGLHWVVGSTWSVQPDSEGAGRLIAKALNAKYTATPCPGSGQIDWSDQDAAHVDALARALTNAGLGCTDFELKDRELLSHNPHYIQIGLPGAYGTCTLAGDQTANIGSFDRTKTGVGAFATGEQASLCSGSKTTRFVIGSDWFIAVSSDQAVPEITRVLHGKPFGGACPAS